MQQSVDNVTSKLVSCWAKN